MTNKLLLSITLLPAWNLDRAGAIALALKSVADLPAKPFPSHWNLFSLIRYGKMRPALCLFQFSNLQPQEK
ncbi:hypothetical protein [Herbaspirillum sp.]|uniref:hypothetical protein n=1 Tax=Herbaspirillum sp. TaxID=1890675 RepID=UPI001B155BED|nr:hypothetical protein [Herbaspirillum sp.]MBO9535320.1 hypothetical protein [Herbaspirillum sp.]